MCSPQWAISVFGGGSRAGSFPDQLRAGSWPAQLALQQSMSSSAAEGLVTTPQDLETPDSPPCEGDTLPPKTPWLDSAECEAGASALSPELSGWTLAACAMGLAGHEATCGVWRMHGDGKVVDGTATGS